MDILNHLGRIVQIDTLVEYYDYIKAVEYLICVGYFIVFPIFYRKIIKYDGDAGNRGK